MQVVAAKVQTIALGIFAWACGVGCGEAKSGSENGTDAALSSTASGTAAPATGAVASSATSGQASLATSALPPEEGPQDIDPTEIAASSTRRILKAVADDPALYTNRDFMARSWGVVQLPLPLTLQEVPLPHGLRAILFTGEGAALNKPIVLVVKPNNQIVWSKERPLVGTRERPFDMTLSRGPRGEVFVFWYDEPTKVFAARSWAYDGSIFADFVLLSVEKCDSLNALHWPGKGWIGALLDGRTLRVQFIGENGTRTWPENGVEVPLGAGGGKLTRPQIAIAKADTMEITVGSQKVQVSESGALVK